MSQQTLKELLKPPFGIIENDEDGTVIVDKNGFLQGLSEYYRMNFDQWKEFTNLLVAAMNEKAEREWSEPLHWIPTKSLGYDWIDCPKCNRDYRYYPDISFNFCPHCGQRLLPPKAKE